MKQRPTRRTGKPAYSSKIIKAGALLSDTRTLLTHWDETQSVPENLQRFRRDNLFGKASRSRIEDILGIFRQRFCEEDGLIGPLRQLAQRSVSAEVFDRVIYFYTARSDRLLYDFASRFLFDRQQAGEQEVRAGDAQRFVAELVRGDKITWGSETLSRVTQGLLATLRDFGILLGAVRKRIAPVHLPAEAFAYIAFVLHQDGATGERLVQHPDWKLFLLTPAAVERLFLEAHQHHLISYQAIGSVVRIDFSAESMEELVDGLFPAGKA